MRLRTALAAACTAALAATALADDAHHPANAAGSAAKAQPMSCMEEMGKIYAARDANERQRLMDEHAKSMQASMARMRGAPAGGANAAQRMEMMELRVEMMEMMMHHIMDRQQAPSPRP